MITPIKGLYHGESGTLVGPGQKPRPSCGGKPENRRDSDTQGVFRIKAWPPASQSDFCWLAGGTIPFIRRYSTICP